MATYLELVQELHQVSGASGAAPQRIEGLIGDYARLARFVATADYNVQTRWLNWNFLWARTGDEFHVTPSGPTLPPEDLFTWDTHAMFIRPSAGDDWQPVLVEEYSDAKGQILSGTPGFPLVANVLPDNSIDFDPVPDQGYPFRCDYWKRPVRLTTASQLSAIPGEYHSSVVVGTALGYYAEYDNAQELRMLAQELIESGRSQMEVHELPMDKSEWLMGQGFEVGPGVY